MPGTIKADGLKPRYLDYLEEEERGEAEGWRKGMATIRAAREAEEAERRLKADQQAPAQEHKA